MNLFDPEVALLNDACIDEFADCFTYFHTGPDISFAMRGIFLSALTREETAAGATFHEVFVRAADFEFPPKPGDMVITDKREYIVFDMKQDHGGGLRLALNLERVA